LNRLEAPVECELPDIVEECGVAAIEDARSFVKTAGATLIGSEYDTRGRAVDFRASPGIERLFVMIVVWVPILVPACDAQRQVSQETQIYGTED